MAEELITLDPRDSEPISTEGTAPRATTLDGKVLGLLSNNKPNSEMLLRMVSDLLKDKYAIKEVVEFNKGSHRVLATPETINMLADKCDVVITATAE